MTTHRRTRLWVQGRTRCTLVRALLVALAAGSASACAPGTAKGEGSLAGSNAGAADSGSGTSGTATSGTATSGTQAAPCGPGSPTGLEVGDCALDFTLPDSTGASFTLSDQRGKVALVDISAVW